MGRGLGSGRGRPKGALNKAKPAAATKNVGQVAVDRLFGAPPADPPRGRTDTYVAPEPEVDAEVFHDPEGDLDALAGEGGDCKIINTGPLLEECKRRIKTLPNVTGQRRNETTTDRLKSWIDYEVRLPLPTIRGTQHASRSDDVRNFIARKAVVLAPHEFHGDAAGTIRCPGCDKADKVAVNGWAAKLKPFNSIEDKVYVFSRMYRCHLCPSKRDPTNPAGGNVDFAAHHPKVYDQWPDFVKHELRLVPSAKSGIDASLLALYRRMTCAGVSENDFDDLVTEAHFERHDIKKLVYLSWHARRRQERDARRGTVDSAFSSFQAPADSILRFPTLDLVAGGSNTIPSRFLLNTLTEQEWERDGLRVYYESMIERVGKGRKEPINLQIDHTFKLCKYISNKGGLQSTSLCKVIDASTGEYVGYWFVPSTSLEEMGVVEGLKERLDCGIHTVTLDNAAGGQRFAREKLGAKHALRSIIHIIDLLVQSTSPKHPLQGAFYRQLSNIFYQVSTKHPPSWRRFRFFFSVKPQPCRLERFFCWLDGFSPGERFFSLSTLSLPGQRAD